MTQTDLAAQLAALTERLSALEGQVERLKKNQRVPEEDLVAISAAVAAHLGHDAKVKAVRFSQSSSWTREGRGRVYNRQVLHVR
mgnify:FL=1